MCKSKKRASTPMIGRHAQDRIGRELRAMYAGMITQPLPEELLALLETFEEAEAAQQRLRAAVQALRRANTGLHPNLPARSVPSSLPVRAQQALLARAMLHRSPAKPSGSRKRAVRAAS